MILGMELKEILCGDSVSKCVGKVDFFDGQKRKVCFFVREDVEEEGFYKIESRDKTFYIFVTNLCEMPLDTQLRQRYSEHEYSFDQEERYLLYAYATILLEYRKKDEKKIVGYKTIPRHNDEVYILAEKDFDILNLPKLDFAYVRSGSQKFDTKAGFKKDAYITHWLLCGWTNSGKTNAAKVLLNVTLKGDGDPFAGGVVIDPHGEYYRDLKHFNGLEGRVFHYTLGAGNDSYEEELEVSYQNVWPSYLTEIYDFREETQLNFMHQVANLKKSNWIQFILDNSIEEILEDMKASTNLDISPLVVGAVKNRMRGIFDEDPIVWTGEQNSFLNRIKDGVTHGNWYIIDVSSVGEKTTKVITAMLAKSILRKYKEACTKNKEEWKRYKPAGILVEEAHNYLSPEETGKGNTIAKIAKEGRKFKVFTIVVEQDPSGIDTRILKQIHNKIILQLIPKDARVIVETTPYVDELEKKIPYYSIGEGLFVSTGSFNFALPVKFPTIETWVDENSSRCKKCGKNTMSPAKICINCQNLQKASDITAFM